MVLEKMRKSRADHAIVAQLRAHQWSSDAQKRELLEKLATTPDLAAEDLAWTAADPTPEIRAAGLALLKRRDAKEVFEALVPMLRLRSEAARRAVQRFAKDVAGTNLPYYVHDLMNDSDVANQLAALELVKEIPAPQAREVHRRALESGVAALKARSLKALGESPEQAAAMNAAQLALPLLKDEDERVRLAALAILEKNPNETLISHVLEMMQTASGDVTRAALAALKRLMPLAKSDHAAETLALLSDGHAEVREAAIELLGRVPIDQLARGFVQKFGSSYAWVRDRALDSIGKNKEFVPAVMALVSDPDPVVARAAVEVSLVLEDPRAVPVWLSQLTNPDWWIRHMALERLGLYGAGNEQVFTAVNGALRDPDVWLSAVGALGNLGDPRGSNVLFELFKGVMNRPFDQLEILDALAKLGEKDPRVGPMLAKLTQHEALDTRVREKARHLVGRLQGDEARDALPRSVVVVEKLAPERLPSATLVELLADTVAHGGSDFHVATGFIPHRRVHGTLMPLPMEGIDRERGEQLVRSVLSQEEWEQLQRERQIDICLKVPGLGRFRANFFSQRGGFDASFRVVPKQIPSLQDLGLPPSATELTRYTQGLVLVTGPTGSGKSTTLASLVNRVNETRKAHIITVEDPIEFVHANKEALVNQRQVPAHTSSFARALKAALREDPDVIMIGEMRDLETISLAISASETGHLVFGTLSTTNAPGTIDRIINSFPAAQQGQIRAMISESLKAVISQALLPRADGQGRVAAFEILRGTQSVGALIRESKTYQLPSILQTGQLYGMMTMDQSLMNLVDAGKIDAEVALDRAVKKEPFEKLLEDRREVMA